MAGDGWSTMRCRATAQTRAMLLVSADFFENKHVRLSDVGGPQRTGDSIVPLFPLSFSSL